MRAREAVSHVQKLLDVALLADAPHDLLVAQRGRVLAVDRNDLYADRERMAQRAICFDDLVDVAVAAMRNTAGAWLS